MTWVSFSIHALSIDNCTPARLVFVRRQRDKEDLKPTHAAGNVNKFINASVVAITGMNMKIYGKLPRPFPRSPAARTWFVGKLEKIRITVLRNSSLQRVYFILASHDRGLDAGPLSGFNNEKLNAEFFLDGKSESNFIRAIGYGDTPRLHPCGSRLEFNEVIHIF